MPPPAIIRTTATTAGAKEDENSSSQEDEPNDVSNMAETMQAEIHVEINNNPGLHKP